MAEYEPAAKKQSKQRRVLEELRRRIVSGRLAPGTQLPTRAEISREFDLVQSVVQTVIDQLRRTGFVESRPPVGTFVAQHPPHLHRFALIQPWAAGEHGVGRYWQAIAMAARQIDADATPRRFTVAEGMDGHSDREQYRMLLAEIQQHRLAGLIFAENPYKLAQTPLIQAPGIARVACMSEASPDGIPTLARDTNAFAVRAVNRLVSRGRRRLAVVGGFASDAHVGGKAFDLAVAESGISIPPYWRLALYPLQPTAARGVTHLLFRGAAGERPDGVIVLDDNLLDAVQAGMIDAGLRSPGDVDIVSMANYPAIRPTLAPVHHLGFDTRAMLDCAIELLAAQRRGESVPSITKVRPLFHEELSPATADRPVFVSQPALMP